MDVLEGQTVVLLQLHEVGDRLVHGLGAQAAEGGDDQGPLIQPQLPPCIGAPGVEEFRPDGHTHDRQLLLLLVYLAAFGEIHQDPVRAACRQPGGKARDGVGLMDAGGDAQLAAHEQGREAGIAAGAHDHIGLELPDDLLRALQSRQDPAHSLDIALDVLQIQLPEEPGARQTADLVARLGHQLLLHAADAADEEDLTARIPLPQGIGQGDGGVDVPAGAAAGKDDVHIASSCSFASSRCRETARITPISPRFTARAVPP